MNNLLLRGSAILVPISNISSALLGVTIVPISYYSYVNFNIYTMVKQQAIDKLRNIHKNELIAYQHYINGNTTDCINQIEHCRNEIQNFKDNLLRTTPPATTLTSQFQFRLESHAFLKGSQTFYGDNNLKINDIVNNLKITNDSQLNLIERTS